MATAEKKPKIIVGGGGHARVLWDALSLDPSCKVLGYVDNAGPTTIDLPYLGKDEDLLKAFSPQDVVLINGVGSTTLPGPRQQVYGAFQSRGYVFEGVIHPRAIISSRAVLGNGVQVMPGAVINTGVRLGVNVIINTSASIDHDVEVGDHVHVAPGVVISGNVRIGQGVHLGTGASVIQGVRIGEGVMVAAGAVVTADVPAGKRVQGVPARVYETS